MSGRVCVVGSINMDLVVRAPRLPGAGETLIGGPFERFPGGKGANQAVAASRGGAAVAMIGCIGADEHGQIMSRTLAENGVDVSAVAVDADRATGIAVITVDEVGENTIVVAPGANAALSPAQVDVASDLIEAADVLLMQLEVPLESVARAAGASRSGKARTVLNAAPARDLPRDLLAIIDILIVNQWEAAVIAKATPGVSPSRLAARLRELGAAEVIITLGGEGVLRASDYGEMHVSACPVESVDTVGAGDAFAGAFAAALARGEDTESAIRFGSAAGALATLSCGAIPSLPSLAEIESFIKPKSPRQ